MNSKQLKKLIRQYRKAEKHKSVHTVSLTINIKSRYIAAGSDVDEFYKFVAKGIKDRFNTSPSRLLEERPWRFRVWLRDSFTDEVCYKQQ